MTEADYIYAVWKRDAWASLGWSRRLLLSLLWGPQAHDKAVEIWVSSKYKGA